MSDKAKYNHKNAYVSKREQGMGDWQRIVYEDLANAIIEKACKDYVSLGSNNTRTIDDGNRRVNKPEILNFFRSQWFHELTDIDPEYLILQLDRKVARRERKQIKEIERPKELSVEEKIIRLKTEKAIIENHRKEEDIRLKRELSANAKKMLGLWENY